MWVLIVMLCGSNAAGCRMTEIHDFESSEVCTNAGNTVSAMAPNIIKFTCFSRRSFK
jgi:hypothetical protein